MKIALTILLTIFSTAQIALAGYIPPSGIGGPGTSTGQGTR